MSAGSSTGSGTRARDLLTVDRRRILVTFGAAILVFLVGAFLHPGFASAASVKAILVIASFVGLVAAGETFVLLVGGIDLSIPWVLNAAGVLFATASLGRDSRAAYALLLALGLGALVGLVNGLCISYLAVPAVVMTLAMNGIMEGLTLGRTQGLTCETCRSYAPPALQNAIHAQLAGIPVQLILWFGVIWPSPSSSVSRRSAARSTRREATP